MTGGKNFQLDLVALPPYTCLSDVVTYIYQKMECRIQILVLERY